MKNIPLKRPYTLLVDEPLGINLINQLLSSLRTCFDPWSHEWSETSLEVKIDILKKVVDAGQSLKDILGEYKIRYKNSPASKDTEDGLINLLQYMLTKHI